uniref:IQ and ubiquitin-like domain-containing protein n=1 Tax=Mesocestoides corti TaxID=53468 RepID=A0A5K3EHT1_MESCO
MFVVLNTNNALPRTGVSQKPWCVVVQIKFPYNTIMIVNDLPEGLPFDLLRRLIAEECCDRVKNIKLYYDGKFIKSGITPKRLFTDLSVVPEIDCRFKHPSQTTKIHLGKRTCKLSRTDEVSVYIYKGSETHKDTQMDNLELMIEKDGGDPEPCIVQINWIPEKPKKPFLGGYKRKSDQRLFHHATSQTFPKPIRLPPVPIFSRETQTYELRHAKQDTLQQASTAMSKPGFYVSNLEDNVVSPRPYETADDLEKRRNLCALKIQCCVRRWLARRKVARLRKLRDEYIRFLEDKEAEYQRRKIERFDRDYDRRVQPKTRADFDRMFNALEQWRKGEFDKICATSSNLSTQKARLGILVDKEVELMKRIIQQQINISKYGKMREQEQYIEKAATTNRWTSAHDLEPVEKDTPATLTAKKLLILYENLKSNRLNKTERMDLLLTVKKLAGSHPSTLSCDLVSLVERETELMLRNIPSSMLAGLRKRILHRFIQFCKNPEYNPAVAPHLPIPDKSIPDSHIKQWADTHRCMSCGRYLRTKYFDVSARATHLDVCTFCWRQGNRGRDRIDLDPYRVILEELRKTETRLIIEAIEAKKIELYQESLKALDDAVEDQIYRKKLNYCLAYRPELERSSENQEPLTETKITPVSDRLDLLVSVQDIYFLVSKVWDSRSALSGCSDLGELTLCRWRVNEPWSPWNTLLVTQKEAELHFKLKEIPLESLYADAILTHVRQRLVIAKNAFMRLCPVGRVLTRERWELRNLLRNPEDTKEYRQLRRRKLKDNGVPLYLLTLEQRHEPSIQPPDVLMPVIDGYLQMEDLGIKHLAEKWPLP